MVDEIMLGVFCLIVVYGFGDKELKLLFDWMLCGLLLWFGVLDI